MLVCLCMFVCAYVYVCVQLFPNPYITCKLHAQLVERFLQLRSHLPPHQIVQYVKKEHLNETDSRLLAQSLAEMVGAPVYAAYVCVRVVHSA